MNNLTFEEQDELIYLKDKIANRSATNVEKRRFMNLMLKSSSDNKLEIENYIHSIGYMSIEDFQKDLEKNENDDLINSLLIIGGAILFVIFLKKLLDK